MANKDYISDELLAAYLDGNTSEDETKQVLQALREDKELQEVLDIALRVEDDSIQSSFTTDVIPMLQMAATGRENICAVLCEIYILHRRQLPYNEDWLLNTARRKDWLKPEGTPLYCLGNLLAYSGMFVSRKYNSTLDDIKYALQRDNDVVVGVDREKLYAEEIDMEDLTNHAVVVTHVEDETVTIFLTPEYNGDLSGLDLEQLQSLHATIKLYYNDELVDTGDRMVVYLLPYADY